ncbi:uncharacterized protein LOC144091696 isoform X6 [Stigmatopora argus]
MAKMDGKDGRQGRTAGTDGGIKGRTAGTDGRDKRQGRTAGTDGRDRRRDQDFWAWTDGRDGRQGQTEGSRLLGVDGRHGLMDDRDRDNCACFTGTCKLGVLRPCRWC